MASRNAMGELADTADSQPFAPFQQPPERSVLSRTPQKWQQFRQNPLGHETHKEGKYIVKG